MTVSDRPALLGGTPVRSEGPPAWPLPDEDVLHALEAAYADGSWGKYHGGHVERLETCLASEHGVEFAAACGSGTFAVELAIRALKVGDGDEVILSAYDYPGNFLNVHAVGARPVLVDVAPESWNLDPAKLETAVGSATRAIIASHLHGGIVPMGAVMAFAERHGLPVIEDAAQMPGAVIEGRKAGTWGDVGILSFGGSKPLTAGRGGAMLTRHGDVHQRARLSLNRGNQVCPLSELQAAVLLPQLDKLETRNAQRARNVSLLIEKLSNIPGLRPFEVRCADTRPGYYKVGFQFEEERFGLPRERFLDAVRAEGMAFDEGFRALHVGRSPQRYRAAGTLGEAERAHRGAVVLHHPVLLGSETDIEQIAEAVRKTYANAALLRT
jgi:dTDP-4-amino-4,6-dideoxygalactose transaminase